MKRRIALLAALVLVLTLCPALSAASTLAWVLLGLRPPTNTESPILIDRKQTKKKRDDDQKKRGGRRRKKSREKEKGRIKEKKEKEIKF